MPFSWPSQWSLNPGFFQAPLWVAHQIHCKGWGLSTAKDTSCLDLHSRGHHWMGQKDTALATTKTSRSSVSSSTWILLCKTKCEVRHHWASYSTSVFLISLHLAAWNKKRRFTPNWRQRIFCFKTCPRSSQALHWAAPSKSWSVTVSEQYSLTANTAWPRKLQPTRKRTLSISWW